MSSEDQVKVETAMDILLVLLYARGKKLRETIAGITKLEKLVFLLAKETILGKLVDQDFSYEPYHFGPYSVEVLDNIEALKELGLVKAVAAPARSYVEESDRYQVDADSNAVEQAGNMETFELTDDGIKVAETLFNSMDQQQREEIERVKSRFNSLDLRQLLRYVYKKYPESTTESKIKDYVLA